MQTVFNCTDKWRDALPNVPLHDPYHPLSSLPATRLDCLRSRCSILVRFPLVPIFLPQAEHGPQLTAPADSSYNGPQTAPDKRQERSTTSTSADTLTTTQFAHHQHLNGYPWMRQYHLRHMLR